MSLNPREVVRNDKLVTGKMIADYIVSEFGIVLGWNEMRIPIPPFQVPFQVIEPIPTPHETCGVGLDHRNRLPIGKYEIVDLGVDEIYFWLRLRGIEDGKFIRLCAGHIHVSRVDWRGIRNLTKAT